ncbi:MAG: hypothetical protein DRQ78_11680 [Epsilonproteobacteria bacterium]|nr:MAG: hypothetical protein DRQ78_11680 [Campylobacterota bacterium]
MSATAQRENTSLLEDINKLLSFSLSDKLKFAIKASLSMALAYLIPLSQGWSQPGTAATTVMLIAAMGSVGDSVMKGVLRVIGTVIGATVGMTLIALFPQDRETYLLVASVIATLFLYLARAYKGDMTVFMLSTVTLLMMFQNGEVDDVFIFGIDKTYMTIVGISIYTFVGVFLWPVHLKDSSIENATNLSQPQSELYLLRDAKKEERKTLHQTMIAQEALLDTSLIASDSSSMEMNFSKTQWYDMVHSYKKINEILTLLSHHDKASYVDNFSQYVTNHKHIDEDILALLKALPLAWEKQEKIEIPQALKYEYNMPAVKTLSQLERAEMSTTINDMLKLHKHLCSLATKLNSLISPLPTFFHLEDIPKPSNFIWFDIEDLKGSIITFIVFWTATLLWIYVNPPGGFMIVLLATALSVLTTFSPLKPSLLIIIFSFSFVFATAMYIFVLPNLHYAWELGLFIFIYSFIGFYFINPMLAVFFILGTATLGINNTMNYNFDIFLMTLFVFYAFLFLLLLFYYIPFSTKAEHLFLSMKKRFFTLSKILLENNHSLSKEKYSKLHLRITVKKMQLWASKLDYKYFESTDKELLLAFTKECGTFAYLLAMLHDRNLKMLDNPLIKTFKKEYKGRILADIIGEYAQGKEVKEVDDFWKDEKKISSNIEERLKDFFMNENTKTYKEKDIIEFYENISLHRNVWLALLSCQNIMEKIDFKALETSRF